MNSTLSTESTQIAKERANTQVGARWFAGRQGRRLRESLLAYLFLAPALLIIGTFGLFPLIFAAYESTLIGLNKVLGTYDGLNNYVKAVGNLTYVLSFWAAVAALYFAIQVLVQALQRARTKHQNLWLWLPAGLLTGAGLATFLVFVYRFLPALLAIPGKLRGKDNTPEKFRQLVSEAWWSTPVQRSFWLFVLLVVLGLALAYLIEHFRPRTALQESFLDEWTGAIFLLIFSSGLLWLTWTEMNKAYAAALKANKGLDIWSQVIMISAGFLLLLLAWWLWDSANARASNVSTFLRLASAAMLIVGAWLLIAELPRVIASSDKEWWMGLEATVWYSLGTIPAQLIISLVLATLLFQEIRGKSFFRIVYFIPYIAPFVGTAAVFRILFSASSTAPINRITGAVGMTPFQWLGEPTGLFQLILGKSITLPAWAAGPSLALIVIIIYGTWTFIGFNTVVFLAGLGNIPRDVYEAASMDGAGRWAQFRHITLPLLSPTLYFLTLYSVIGTFKAFNHIYVLRSGAALGTTDTASVVIFQAFKRDTRYGYASALAILLLLIILILTYVNNRVASKRVFYG